jgi:hypothetical protein
MEGSLLDVQIWDEQPTFFVRRGGEEKKIQEIYSQHVRPAEEMDVSTYNFFYEIR